jgi:hypothetical protein
MFASLAKLFRKEIPKPIEPFADNVLGQFTFDRDLGWKTHVLLGGQSAELILGSAGEPPSEAMLKTARSWVDSWTLQFPKIIEYIRGQLQSWSGEPDLPQPGELEVESVNILWSDKPDAAMIYFHYPGDDIRLWHVTFYGFEPNGFADDD